MTRRRSMPPHKTLYNRWKRWSEAGVFIRMMEGVSGAQAERRTLMIDATYLKAHRTASPPRGGRPHDGMVIRPGTVRPAHHRSQGFPGRVQQAQTPWQDRRDGLGSDLIADPSHDRGRMEPLPGGDRNGPCLARRKQSVVGLSCLTRSECSDVGFAREPIPIAVHMVSVAWLPRGDILVIVGSSLAAAGVVLVRGSLTPFPTEFRLSRSIRREHVGRAAKGNGEHAHTDQPHGHRLLVRPGSFQRSVSVPRHSATLHRRGFPAVDQRGKRLLSAMSARSPPAQKLPLKALAEPGADTFRCQTVGTVPPSTTISEPWIELARSEARKAMASATSSGSAPRPMAMPPRPSRTSWRASSSVPPLAS